MDLPIDDFLETRDLDAVLALTLNLLGEVVELRERVRVLEGEAPDDEHLQERVDDLVRRVGRPLRAASDLL